MVKKQEEQVEEKNELFLTDLPGVGELTAEKLMEAGFKDVLSIAVAPPAKLMEASGMTEKAARKVINAARDSMSMGFEQGDIVMERMKKRILIPLGCSNFDDMMKGGFESGSITECFGEWGCHSEDTTVMTKDGERNYKEIKMGEYVLGVKKGKIVDTKVLNVFEYDYEGYMLEFKTQRQNLFVTPNHTVYFKRVNSSKERTITAQEAFDKTGGIFPMGFGYEGKKREKFNLMKYYNKPKLKYPQKSHINLIGSMKTEDLLFLAGFYIAEGWIGKYERGEYVFLSIGTERKKNGIIKVIKKAGISFSDYGTRIGIFHKDLAHFLMNFGMSAITKNIPIELFELDKKYLLALFEGMMLGDGGKNKFIYYTSSEKLRDQFIVLCHLLGYSATWRKAKIKSAKLKDGRVIIGKHQPYRINICYSPSGTFDKRYNMKRHKYKGKIWCFETETGNFFTMRGGNPGFSGNSGKTQLGHILTINTLKMFPDSFVVFIDSESTFRPDRLTQLAKGNGLNPEKTLKQVLIARARNSDHQMLLAQKIKNLIIDEKKNVKLVVVDSLTAHFRAEYIGRGTLAERQQKLNKHMHDLMEIADLYNILVYVTNQVSADPAQMFGDPTKAIGGHICGHNAATRIYLRKGAKGSRVAKLIDSSFLEDQECNFFVTANGLKNV